MNLPDTRQSGNSTEVPSQTHWLPRIAVMGRISSAVRIASTTTRKDSKGKVTRTTDIKTTKLNNTIIVSPDVLEATFSVSPLLSNIYIHGQRNSTALVAIVSIAIPHDTLSSYLNSNLEVGCPTTTTSHLKDGDREQYQENNIIDDAIYKEIQRVAALSELRVEEIPKAIHVDRTLFPTWTVESGLINASLKKNRLIFQSVYKQVLDKLHVPFLVISDEV